MEKPTVCEDRGLFLCPFLKGDVSLILLHGCI
nr:MAG TPA: hypothetical protein [Caudoviricetes sp.]